MCYSWLALAGKDTCSLSCLWPDHTLEVPVLQTMSWIGLAGGSLSARAAGGFCPGRRLTPGARPLSTSSPAAAVNAHSGPRYNYPGRPPEILAFKFLRGFQKQSDSQQISLLNGLELQERGFK